MLARKKARMQAKGKQGSLVLVLVEWCSVRERDIYRLSESRHRRYVVFMLIGRPPSMVVYMVYGMV